MSKQITCLLDQLGVDKEKYQTEVFAEHWEAFSLKKNGQFPKTKVLIIEEGPKNITEARLTLSKISSCIAIFRIKKGDPYNLFLKVHDKSVNKKLESQNDYEQMNEILRSCGYSKASSSLEMATSVKRAIESIPTHETDFDNRGLFSSHYIKNRMLDDLKMNVSKQASQIKGLESTKEILDNLGWKNLKFENDGSCKINDVVTIVVAKKGAELGVKTRESVAPSYVAISHLKNTSWVILTNSTRWRLYTNKISASSTNYLEIDINSQKDIILKYLVALFGAYSYEAHDKKTHIDVILENGKTYARELEEDLSSKILHVDGIFLDLIKGVLGDDAKSDLTDDELDSIRKTALKIMYRVWFLLYAESRNLMPLDNENYQKISLQNLRTQLDTLQTDKSGDKCWNIILELFKGIRKGNPKCNLPAYNGELFKIDECIDSQKITNEFLVPFLRGLFEKDGEAMDYASLGVRHLGNIYETLMEFSVRQAKKNIMLLETSDGVKEVESRHKATYSYKKYDLYLASKGGIVSRKNSASYYTPEEIVRFLVKQGLDPLLTEREPLIKNDLKNYKINKNEKYKKICIDRLLDLQILDPAMGSGHFLVEALNQMASWVTRMLNEHKKHPLVEEIENDRIIVISTQKKNGIIVDESLLKDDVLLKRKIMKRCIFGVDLNPLAVELAKLSLWLDSFAIGIPLTYMNHHLKVGDSTIGMWRDSLMNKKSQTLDTWIEDTDKVGNHISRVSCNSDITTKQVQKSEEEYLEYEKQMLPHKTMLDVLTASKMDDTIIPKSIKDKISYVERFGRAALNSIKLNDQLFKVWLQVQKSSNSYRFFHWELEMMDAFTDSRRGFDLIVGNPPWDTVKPKDDEFFTPYYLPFRKLSTKTMKNEKINKICENIEIYKLYNNYKRKFKNKNKFYRTFEMQGVGDKDLWHLVLERTLQLVSKNGIISMLIPSQVLLNRGGTEIRKKILQSNILSLYVFENVKKIFPIASDYRFVLLTFRNMNNISDGELNDTFPAGYYLHNLSSLENSNSEKEKFFNVSKKLITKTQKDYSIIPEVGGAYLKLLAKLSGNRTIKNGFEGWTVDFAACFHKTDDADLLNEDGKGWPVLEGKHIHQFLPKYVPSKFHALKLDGLKRESKKRVYMKKYKEIYNSPRLLCRNITGSKHIRTIISSIVAPQTFHTNSVYTLILKHNNEIVLNVDYNKKIAYLCGILNSMTFDFMARTKIRSNAIPIMPTLTIPMKSKFDDQIIQLAAKLSVGYKEFDGFAESLNIRNNLLTPNQRIDTFARLDSLVACIYNLTKEEYNMVLNSFKFDEDVTFTEQNVNDWSEHKTLRNFYGEVRKLCPKYYDEYARGNKNA